MMRTPDIVIRKAEADDRAALHDLLTRSWMTTWAPECPEAAIDHFRSQDPVSAYLGACLPQIDLGVLDGQVAAAMHLDGEHLAALHVAPALTGLGIGSVMMDAAEARGAQRLEVRAFNESAIRFYGKRGWCRFANYEAPEMGVPMRTHEYRRGQDPAQD